MWLLIRRFSLILFFCLMNFVYPVIDYLDTTFGPGATGIVITSVVNVFNESSSINAITNSSGKIIVAGSSIIDGNSNLIIARYNSDGTLDTSFNGTGIVSTTAGSASATANAVSVDINNNIVVAGTDAANNILLVRYTSSGTLDATFGVGGIVSVAINGSDGSITKSMIIDSNNKILVGGTTIISGNVYLFVARFNTNGSLDTTFNTVGYSTLTGSGNFTGNSLAVDLNAKIVICGSFSGISGNDFLVARFNTNGTLDTTFNSTGDFPGTVTTAVVSNATNIAQSILVDSSNRYIVAGYSEIGGTSLFALARYTNSGVLDTTFGPGLNGIVTTSIGQTAQANAAVLDQSGNIVATGISDNQIATARYNPSGSLDTTFGIGGVFVQSVNDSAQALSLTIQSTDGKIVVGGLETNTLTNESLFTLIRYNKNNTDFVNITSISNNSTIKTKIPTISGISSTANGATKVQILVNGIPFSTVASSGTWTAGTSSVLPMGTNYIQANLQTSASVTIVSEKIKFIVVDTFKEDSIFGYNSTTQTTTSGTFSKLPFDTVNVLSPTTWSYDNTNREFICQVAGRYYIEYNGVAGTTDLGTGPGLLNVSTTLFIAGAEYVGSEMNANINTASSANAVTLSKGIVIDLAVGNRVSLNFAATGLGTGTLVGLIKNTGAVGTQNPYSLSIVRIG